MTCLCAVACMHPGHTLHALPWLQHRGPTAAKQSSPYPDAWPAVLRPACAPAHTPRTLHLGAYLHTPAQPAWHGSAGSASDDPGTPALGVHHPWRCFTHQLIALLMPLRLNMNPRPHQYECLCSTSRPCARSWRWQSCGNAPSGPSCAGAWAEPPPQAASAMLWGLSSCRCTSAWPIWRCSEGDDEAPL